MAFLAGWSYRKKITIDNTYVDSDLTDFPVLVKFTSDASIGANALSSGNDIRFTSVDGTTLLKYEREAFAVSAGNASGTFWVKVPTVAGSADTEIYLYYGNSGASDGADKNNVWDSNYAAVWHLNESGNGTASEFTDSTSNARHGRGGDGTAAAVPTRATGKVEYGQDFDNSGTADFIGSMGAVSSFSFIQNTGVFTVELLLNGSGSTTSEQGVIGSTPTSGDKGIYLSWNASNLKRCDFFIARGGAGSSVATATNSVSSGAWHHVAFTGDASTIRSYIDGAAGATGSIGGTTSGDSTRVLNAGRWNGATPGGYYDGLIDEIRISTVQRSAAWLKFVYRNIFEADNEISLGTAEAAPSAPQQPWVRLLLLQDDNYIPPAITALNAYTLTCATGNLTLTGNATILTVQRTLTADQGSLTLTGNDATFQRGYTLTCGQGSLTLTGNATGLTVQRTIAADTGNLTLTGFDVGLTTQRTLSAGQGSLTLAGQDVGLTVQRTLACATGYITATGIDATLTYTPNVGAYTLACATGYLVIVGEDVTLTYTSSGTGTIAYNPAVFAAMQSRTFPKLHIPPTTKLKPQEQHYATDYAIPCQRIKLLSFPGEIIPDVHRYVTVCGRLAGTVKINSVGIAKGASYAKSYSGKPGGIADVVGRKRHIKRLKVRALREERALMAALARGVPLGDAIQEMVRT